MSLRRLSSMAPLAGAYTTSGQMDDWIILLQPGARNTDGSFQPPSPFTSTWSAISALQGDELLKAQQIVQEVTHQVCLFYQPGITQAMLVAVGGLGGRIFQIKAIQDVDERQVELRLLCVERNQSA